MRTYVLLAFTFLSLSLLAQEPGEKLKITHLKGDFYVFTTYQNFKGNKVSANGLYVVTKQGAILIDTPWDSTQFQPLLDSIEQKHDQKVVMCLATHSHEDRSGGLEYYSAKGIKTYTSSLTDSISRIHQEKRAQYHFDKDALFDIGGCQFRTFYAGEGHTTDNIVVWFAKEKILYGGCLIKSTEATDLGYVKESNLQAWPVTLKKVKEKYAKAKFIITGHQDWLDTRSIEHTLDLLRKAASK